MWSNKHDLNFSVPNTIMRNCVKRAISYTPSVVYGTANNNVIPREKIISHNKHENVPTNLRLTSCDTSSKYLTKLHPFEETDQKFVSDLSTLKNEIKPDEEILLQDISQTKWPLSRYDKKDSGLSLVQLGTEKEDLSIATGKILEKYFTICDTILFDDGQHLIDHESDVTIESSKEQDSVKTQQRSSMNEDSVPLGHKLTLILPRCNCTTSKLSRHFASNAK